MKSAQRIPVIDIFAGPGGLSEGFAAHGFDIRLSVEKEASAHQTLELRAFFRRFAKGAAPREYYEHLRGRRTREELFNAFPAQAAAARQEAWQAELGRVPREQIQDRIRTALDGATPCCVSGREPAKTLGSLT